MATTEPTAPLPETGQAPTVDTPAAATPAPAEATPQSPAPTVDWENRYKAAQAELTRQQMARAEAERQRDALRLEQPQPDDDSGIPVPARAARRTSETEAELRAQRDAALWQIAEQVYGGEVIAAYTKAQELLRSATTPADYVGAFEVYRQARDKAPQPAAQAAPAAPVPAPSVDSNRSDGPLLTEVDQKLREAAAAKDLHGWIAAKLRGAL